MAKDSEPEKWGYDRHKEVKHELLEKYLSVWITILGTRFRKICYFDCFAGRGEYEDGTFGSPIKAIEIADRKAKDYEKILLVFIEKNLDNFNNLVNVLERKKQEIVNLDKLVILPMNTDFNSAVSQAFGSLNEGRSIAPSFFFVDPFGYSGIPFNAIKRMLSYRRTEVFFTYMVDSIRRFISYPAISETLTDLFGTDQWQEIIEKPDRETALVELYKKQLHEDAGAKYSLHFRMSESRRLRTLYYLIHATNNLKGHYVMKDIMHKASPHGSFAFLGPKDSAVWRQTRLVDDDIKDLKRQFLVRFEGKTLTFDQILEEICIPWYLEPPYTEGQYKKALKELERENKCSVQRISSKKSGLKQNDVITFPARNESNHDRR